jgi:hypothetical protein
VRVSRLTDLQIKTISDTLKKEQGANLDEIHQVLQRTLTVGALKQILAKLDDSLPVELEVIVDVTDGGDCSAQPGLAIHHYEVTNEDDGFPRLTLVGAPPQLAQVYAEAFELEPLKQ